MSANRLRASSVAAALALLGVLAGPAAGAAEAGLCEVRLTVEVSPSVPRATDDGFLSSLLNNHSAYRLDLLRLEGFSVIEVDLRGPGPDYRCEMVVEAMRKDARVESIQVES